MRDLSLAEYRALAEFRYQIRRFLHFSEEQVRSLGLEPQQHQLLLAIKGLPPEQRHDSGTGQPPAAQASQRRRTGGPFGTPPLCGP